ncbi:MAG: hypothetical protein ACREBF_03030 [Candidatus Micrarchaeales archaeon]
MVILNANPVQEKQNQNANALKDTHRLLNPSTMENTALRQVIQESWKPKVKHDKHLTDLIEDHASEMYALLGTPEYEVLGLNNIIPIIKNKSKSEAKGYMDIIKGLAYLYKTKLGADKTLTYIIGVTARFRDVDAMQRYYNLEKSESDFKIKKIEERIGLENNKLEQLAVELKSGESSFITRFFKRGQLIKIKSQMNSKKRRIARLSTRASRVKKTFESVNKMVKG